MIPALTFFTFISDHGDGAELDALYRLPGLGIALGNFDAVETGRFEGLDKLHFLHGTRDTTAPQHWIVLEMDGHGFIGDDIADGNPAAAFEDSVDLAKKLPLIVIRY